MVVSARSMGICLLCKNSSEEVGTCAVKFGSYLQLGQRHLEVSFPFFQLDVQRRDVQHILPRDTLALFLQELLLQPALKLVYIRHYLAQLTKPAEALDNSTSRPRIRISWQREFEAKILAVDPHAVLRCRSGIEGLAAAKAHDAITYYATAPYEVTAVCHDFTGCLVQTSTLSVRERIGEPFTADVPAFGRESWAPVAEENAGLREAVLIAVFEFVI
jgi:hypothetical protein